MMNDSLGYEEGIQKGLELALGYLAKLQEGLEEERDDHDRRGELDYAGRYSAGAKSLEIANRDIRQLYVKD